MKVYRKDLVADIAAATGLTKIKTMEVINRLQDAVADHLATGDQVALSDFGTFAVKQLKAKDYPVPGRPGEFVHKPAHYTVKFSAAKNLKIKVNGEKNDIDE